tara:strand:- start:1400 stop:1618 length:219 start_codon:yes stop_codon:yes gene_type:complete
MYYRSILFKTLLFLFGNVLFISKAYAYLDPGTGSIILQAIIAFFAGLITYCSIYWVKLKNKIKNIFQKFKKK